MEQRGSSILQNIDWFTVILYLVLITLGWFNIYSASYSADHASFSMATRYGRQMIWIGAAVVIAIVVLVIDSKFYSTFAELIYGALMLILLSVLLFGSTVNGAKAWIVLGPIQVQPAEFAKIAASLTLAKYMSRYHFRPESFKSMMIVFGICFLPSAFILLQNDTGSALVFAALLIAYFREGMKPILFILGLLMALLFVLSLLFELHIILIVIEALAFVAFFVLRDNHKELGISFLILLVTTAAAFGLCRWLAPQWPKYVPLLIGFGLAIPYYLYYTYRHKLGKIAAVIGIAVASIGFTFSVGYFFDNVLAAHQRARINHLLGIEVDLQGAGYNVNQSMIAIGSGGLTGKGYLQGTQTKFKFVPEQSTDFIFCTIGEEWGFMGTTLLLLLFLTLLVRLLVLAERQKSKFSRIYGYCVASIFFFHIAVNVGMTIGIAPVIGIPLPFFSYGGSSLWGFTMLLFIFLKLDCNRMELIT
ncbi:MAG: rod shape-determining protein RodA [Salinivirgaceae bacterium]|nr:rod shape-determining protein RodA [Salinivirgaceae bacterium]